jgi:hypothetical protein
MLYQLILRVYVVQDNVGIPAVARSKNDYLEMFVDFLKALARVRADVKPRL